MLGLLVLATVSPPTPFGGNFVQLHSAGISVVRSGKGDSIRKERKGREKKNEFRGVGRGGREVDREGTVLAVLFCLFRGLKGKQKFVTPFAKTLPRGVRGP